MSEEEAKAGQVKAAARVKVKVAVAPLKEDELTKQLKYQQHQIHALVGLVKNFVSLVRATQPSSSVVRTGHPSYGRGGSDKKSQSTGRVASWGKGQPLLAKSHSPA